MIKLLIAGTVILLIAFGGIYLSVTQNQKNPPTKISSSIDAPASSPHEIPLQDPPQASSSPLSTPKTSAAPQPSSAPSLTSLQNQVAALEKSNQDLLARVLKLENSQTTTVSTSNQVTVSKAPLYIYPSGSGGSATSTDWSTLSSYDITIDPTLYSGYSGMQLEVNMSLTSGNGTGYARLQDTTNGTSILSSLASTSSENLTWVSSSNFTVSGKKSYKLQLKTLTGYQVTVSNMRIKVNF